MVCKDTDWLDSLEEIYDKQNVEELGKLFERNRGYPVYWDDEEAEAEGATE